ncbi:MAG TPA: PEP-CTERM sorting domain-containing protein [Bryobacteraceae bacterium]|nr:PEP-CTERM sorting domain-containing protein [Bryobacteraceae bacterium]
MKKGFASIFLVALCALMMTSLASATPTCASLISINVININAQGGCTAFGLTFNNFAVLNASGGTGVAEIDLVNVSLLGGNDVDLNFNPNLGVGTIGGTITDLHLAFTVSGGLIGADLNVGGNGAGISEEMCNVFQGINGGCLLANQVWNTVGISGQAGTCLGNTASGTTTTTVCHFDGGVSQGWVFKDISINSVTGSHLTSFDESFIIPEPMTLSLMGAGLLGIGLLGRRLRK